MDKRSLAGELELLETARTLTPVQRQIGHPARSCTGALLEIAVRLLKFPEEITADLAELQLPVAGGEGAGAAIQSTASGEQFGRPVADGAFVQQLEPVKRARRGAPAGATADVREPSWHCSKKWVTRRWRKVYVAAALDYYTAALGVGNPACHTRPGTAAGVLRMNTAPCTCRARPSKTNRTK